jgi:hypothetical protein
VTTFFILGVKKFLSCTLTQARLLSTYCACQEIISSNNVLFNYFIFNPTSHTYDSGHVKHNIASATLARVFGKFIQGPQPEYKSLA